MYGRAGLDRFRKAQSLEPFSVSAISSATTTQPDHNKATYQSVAHSQCHALYQQNQNQQQHLISQKPVGSDAVPEVVPPPHVTQIGGGQSTWQPPDWAIEPRTGVYFLEVLKDGEILDRINLDKRRNLFGRQHHACDFVLDHQSVSRQHAAVIPHKNGSIYVIDLGSAHGTFVANERLGKDSPVELEVGQSIRFAASTRTYILRKNDAALFPPPVPPEIDLPPPPDPCDEEAVLSYNTILNRYGLSKSNLLGRTCRPGATTVEGDDIRRSERASKRIRRLRVAFRDQVGGELVEVVGVSDGADVETEPGPLGVKEGSLVGKYESLVQITVIPKGKDQDIIKEDNCSPKGVTSKLQEILNRVKSTPKTGIYDDLYGEAFSGKVGTSWAYASSTSAGVIDSLANVEGKALGSSGGKPHNDWSLEDDDDDLFGD